jgi:hypothetical protein
MSVRILPENIQNLQQIESVVAGPDGANRLFIVSGQFDSGISVYSPDQGFIQQKETFTLLLDPKFTRQQFYRAISTASLAKTSFGTNSPNGSFQWQISNIDADWDDESGQVELRIEVLVGCNGTQNNCTINGLAFQTTILAMLPN